MYRQIKRQIGRQEINDINDVQGEELKKLGTSKTNLNGVESQIRSPVKELKGVKLTPYCAMKLNDIYDVQTKG